MSTFEPNQDCQEADTPRGLPEALRAVYGRVPEVPPEIGRAVLEAARRRTGEAGRGRLLRFPRVAAGAAAAAALGLAVSAWVLAPRVRPGTAGRPPAALTAREMHDIDGDGRVDMVDALRVARAVGAGDAGGAWDVNGDGVVDGGDVDAVAARAVRLPGGGA